MAERLVYTHPWRSFFVAKDIEALRQHHLVDEHAFNSGHALLLPWDVLRQALFLLIARAKGARVAICHFAGHHSVLPVLLGFRTYIIVAGSDSCSFPGIDYGSFRKKWMGRAMAYSMRRAAAILPVHGSLERFSNTYSDAGPRDQGYAHFVSDLSTPSQAIPYGFAMEKWQRHHSPHAPRAVLCIATAASFGNAIHFRKGIDLLIDAAAELRDVRFTIVGTNTSSYKDLPPNMRSLGLVDPKQLRELFAEHGIYVQASIMEGFPNALCEAMLMGCIPIVSNMTSMPAIVGDAGEILTRRDPHLLIAAIRSILELSPAEAEALRCRARERVLKYTMETRSQALLDAIGMSMDEGQKA